ncbi:MAG: preprotein translocase subunit YajC [Paramuribaculum sp.]|nr:preprotein translocase subunit YajC [Paramuribaculum sp.]
MINNLVLLQDSNAGGAMNLIMIVVLIVIFYFFMIRPQQKKQKEIRKFREGIKEGDTIVTAGGIYGKVRRIKDTTILIEISKGVEIRVDKGSVYPSAADVINDTTNKIEDAK